MAYSIKHILFLADSNGAGLFNAITGAYGGVPMASTNWDMTLDLMWGAPSEYGVDRSRYHIEQVRKGAVAKYDLVVTGYCAGDAIGDMHGSQYNGKLICREETFGNLMVIRDLWGEVGTPVLIALPTEVNWDVLSSNSPPASQAEKDALAVENHYETVAKLLTGNKERPFIRLTLPAGKRAKFFMPPETGDWVHMSPAGYIYMAQRLVKKMRGLVK